MQIDLLEILDKNYVQKYTVSDASYISTTICNQYSKSVLIRRYWDVNQELAYILGLWAGDKYVYGNRIGLCNIEHELLGAFAGFLRKVAKPAKVRYVMENSVKTKVYINSAVLRRTMEALEREIPNLINANLLSAYFAGRIDADGCIMPSNLRHNSGLAKITYGSLLEAEKDAAILRTLGYHCCITRYKGRNAFDLKMSVLSCIRIFPKLLDYSRHQEKRGKIKDCIVAAGTIKLVP